MTYEEHAHETGGDGVGDVAGDEPDYEVEADTEGEAVGAGTRELAS